MTFSRLTDLGLREARQTTNNVARDLKKQIDADTELESEVQTRLIRLRGLAGYVAWMAEMLDEEIQRRADETNNGH